MKLNYIPELKRPYKQSRSGWEYAVKSFKNVPLAPAKDTIIFDTNVDDTFLVQKKGAYLKDWVGIIHNPPGSYFLGCNILFINDNFRTSLEFCKGLFVLSNYMKNWLESQSDIIVACTPINVLTMPTDKPKFTFSFDKFRSNKGRKIVQIGHWLKDIDAIYSLPLAFPTFLRKALLPYIKTKRPEQALIEQLNLKLHNDTHQQKIQRESKPDFIDLPIKVTPPPPISTDDESNTTTNLKEDNKEKRDLSSTPKNKKHLLIPPRLRVITERETKSVYKSEYLSNMQYDELFTSNIVFLKFFCPVVSTTIVECIVRNTPVLVNKISSIVEYLGEKYPFYYETLEEAGQKACNLDLILDTWKYLKNMDKTCFTGQYFVQSVLNSDIHVSLL